MVMLQMGSPWMLAALLLVAGAGASWWWLWRARRLHRAAVGADVAGGRAGSAVSRVLLALTLALLAFAAARPQWSEGGQTLGLSDFSLVVALDVSDSMAAEDVPDATGGRVSRFTAAQSEVRRLIDARRGDRVGLVIFAGGAFLRFPLTRDHDAALQVLDALQPGEALVEPGSNLANAIDMAASTIRRASEEDGTGVANGAIVVVSDGEVHEGDAPLAASASRSAGLQVYTVGVGTEAGATIPLGPFGEPRIDPRSGRPIITRLDAEHLQSVADAGGGRFIELDSPGRMAAMSADLAALDLVRPVIVEETALAEQFQWFAGAAAWLLVLASAARVFGVGWGRTALLALLSGAAIGTSSCGVAGVERLNRDGAAHYEAGEYEQALVDWREAQRIARASGQTVDPRLHLNAGRALHQLGDYERAEIDSLTALRSDDAATRAVAWFHTGNHRWANDDLLGARLAYIEALRESPSMLDAKVNLEMINGILESLQEDQAPSPGEEAAESEPEGETSASGDGSARSPAASVEESAELGDPEDAPQAMSDEGGDAEGSDAEGLTGALPTTPTFAEEDSYLEQREAARAALQAALEELPLENASLEQALAVLDALRAVPGERMAAGRLPDADRPLDW